LVATGLSAEAENRMIRKPRAFGPKRLTPARQSGWFCLAIRRRLGRFVRVLAGSSRDGMRTNGERARLQPRGNAYKNERMSRARETLFREVSRRGDTFWALCTRNLPQDQCETCPNISPNRALIYLLIVIGGPQFSRRLTRPAESSASRHCGRAIDRAAPHSRAICAPGCGRYS
jgi:hypothetical protein